MTERHMSKSAFESTATSLRISEGFREQAYDDATGRTVRAPVGKLTIGYGTNIEGSPLTRTEGEWLMRHRLGKAVVELETARPWVGSLPDDWQRGLMDMAYNMGVPRLLKFKRMFAALKARDGETAAAEALNSNWVRENQVGKRAYDIAALFRGRELSV